HGCDGHNTKRAVMYIAEYFEPPRLRDRRECCIRDIGEPIEVQRTGEHGARDNRRRGPNCGPRNTLCPGEHDGNKSTDKQADQRVPCSRRLPRRGSPGGKHREELDRRSEAVHAGPRSTPALSNVAISPSTAMAASSRGKAS